MDPLVSIIVPAYNAESFIAQTVQSVIDQTYTHWKLIIINDGSTDGTAAYLETLVHPAIKVIHQCNKGVSAARNVGLEQTVGEYITFLDADDILTPNSLEIRVRFLNEHPEVDLVDGWISVRDESLGFEFKLYKPYYQGLLLPRLLRLDPGVFLMPSYMFRKDKLYETRFNEHMTHCEDFLFFMELASRSQIVYSFVTEVVLLYRRPKNSAMSNTQGIENGYLQLLRKSGLLNGVSLLDRVYMKLRVARILFLSWLSRGEPLKAGKSLFNCIWIK